MPSQKALRFSIGPGQAIKNASRVIAMRHHELRRSCVFRHMSGTDVQECARLSGRHEYTRPCCTWVRQARPTQTSCQNVLAPCRHESGGGADEQQRQTRRRRGARDVDGQEVGMTTARGAIAYSSAAKQPGSLSRTFVAQRKTPLAMGRGFQGREHVKQGPDERVLESLRQSRS